MRRRLLLILFHQTDTSFNIATITLKQLGPTAMSRVNKRKAKDELEDVTDVQHKKFKAVGKQAISKATHSDDEDDAGFTFTKPPARSTASGKIAAANGTRHAPAPTRTSPRLQRRTAQTATLSATPRVPPRRDAPVPAAESLVEEDVVHRNIASDASDSFVALPVSDTPIIRKNQHMRQNGDGGHGVAGKRRSSLGMRGKRASSMGNGFASEPHPDVPASEYYRHISTDLPDPVRMKQLLAWCARRTIDDAKNRKVDVGADGVKGAGDKNEERIQAVAIARTIEEEVLKDLIDNKIATSWYQRTEETSTQVEKKPHPKNEANAAKLDELQQRLVKLQEEAASWQKLLVEDTAASSTAVELLGGHQQQSQSQSPAGATTTERFAKSTTQQQSIELDLDLLPAREAEFMHQLSRRPAGVELFDNDWLHASERELEFKVDSLLHGLHAVEQFIRDADQESAEVLSRAAKAMAAADAESRSESTRQGIDTADILRQIARRP